MANAGLQSGVIRQLRTGSSESRVELARQLDVSPSTMGIHVDRLLQQGWLQESAAETSTSGRPPKALQLNPEAGQFIGVDFDGKSIHCVSVDFAQRQLRSCTGKIQSRDRTAEVLRRIQSAIEDVRDTDRPLLGIGIAAPGAINSVDGIGLHYQHIREWKDVPLAQHFSTLFSVPVSVENNVRTMAFAEQSFGKARSLQSAICIGNRSGIGAGILLDGELFRGPDGLAGEIGGWPVTVGRGKCMSLEEVASLGSLLLQIAASVREGRSTSIRLQRNRVTWQALVDAVDSGDRLARRLLADAAETLGQVVAQMSLVLRPQTVVICGPLSELDETYIRPLRIAVEKHMATVHSAAPRVCASELGELVGALGAGAMASRNWEPV